MKRKKIKLILNRSDIGAGTRGSDMGIDAMEIAAINQDNDFFNNYEYIDVKTRNESVYDKVHNSFAKRIGHVLQHCEGLSTIVKETLKKDEFPLILSGDHSSALGTISGIKAAYPNKTLGVIWIDAHADLHSPYTSPSGNIHGMPLAASIADDNRDCQINEVTGDTDKYWKAMKNIGVEGQKVDPAHILFFGVRSTETPENKQIEKYSIKNYKVDEYRYRKHEVCMQEAIKTLEACDMLYVSFDVDSMDCDMISYGTGTPVPKGFDQREVINIINSLIQTEKVIGIEFVEINPLLDTKGNKMAETAFEVLDNLKLEKLVR